MIREILINDIEIRLSTIKQGSLYDVKYKLRDVNGKWKSAHDLGYYVPWANASNAKDALDYGQRVAEDYFTGEGLYGQFSPFNTENGK